MDEHWQPSARSRERAERIVRDLSSRKGLGDEWDQIDPEVQEEIIDLWARIIEGAR